MTTDRATGDVLDLVNTLCGTDSDRSFSTGLVYPAVGRPWGMTYFAPRNVSGGQVFGRVRSRPVNRLHGFTATHAPSPWMGDYGSFTVTPGVGLAADRIDTRANSYRLDAEHARPDGYDVRLLSPEIDCALTATTSCGLLRLTYPAGADAHLVVQLTCPGCEVEQVSDTEVVGIARDGHGLTPGYGCRFVVRLDRAITGARPIAASGDTGAALVLKFDAGDAPVHVHMATSFISHDQARLNLDREMGTQSFDAVRAETADVWRKELNRVQVTGGEAEHRRTFYTCLWRTLLFPHTLTETDADGKAVHYSPYTDQVEPGHLVTDNGFWDTSRAVYPLYSLVWRKQCGTLLDGFLEAYRQSGWMPQWASPGHRACMVGTHSAAVFCDAITKGIEGFDYKQAFESMLKDALEPGDPEAKYGRQQLPEYHALGYCPDEGDIDSVCRTLDYSYNDWCCATVAEAIGETEHLDLLRERSNNWKALFDPELKFFRPKDKAGNWVEPFQEWRWGGPYREGGPWQYRFQVLHDARGITDAYGGVDVVVGLMEQMMTMPPHFDVGTYGGQIPRDGRDGRRDDGPVRPEQPARAQHPEHPRPRRQPGLHAPRHPPRVDRDVLPRNLPWRRGQRRDERVVRPGRARPVPALSRRAELHRLRHALRPRRTPRRRRHAHHPHQGQPRRPRNDPARRPAQGRPDRAPVTRPSSPCFRAACEVCDPT